MSNPPPPPPYGQQPGQPSPYGQQPGQSPYGQNPYGAPPTGPGMGGNVVYAHWGKRLGSYIVDALIPGVVYVIGFVVLIAAAAAHTHDGVSDGAGGAAFAVFGVCFIAAFVLALWNSVFRQGRTGQSLGKSALNTKLVSESTGQPLGAGLTFVRQIAHVLDGICYIGFLWPLWDAKRQTFADKIMSSVVVDV